MARNPNHSRISWVHAPASFVLFALIADLTGPFAAAQEAQEDPGPGDAPLRLELPAARTHVGQQFERRLQLYSEKPLEVFALRIETAPALVRLRSWSFGEGIERHIALHGAPPVCDIIVYPDGSRMFAVMVMDPPFSSEEYGSECLVLQFAVEAESPGTTCILYSGDTPDYEPGDDLLTVISRMRPERRCAPVFIAGAPPIRRGDVDGDARSNITDAIRILRYLFAGGEEPDCADAADLNDDGRVDMVDSVALLRALFHAIEPPWPECSADRTRDSLPSCGRPSC